MDRKIDVHFYPHGNITWQEDGFEICPPGADCEAAIRIDLTAAQEGSGMAGVLPLFDLCVAGAMATDQADKVLCLLQSGQISRTTAKKLLRLACAGSVGLLPAFSGEPVPEDTVPVEMWKAAGITT